MHENVKFTVRLKDITPISDISLIRNPEANNDPALKAQIADWQAIFQDVQYGTEFIIYAKFCGNTMTENGLQIDTVQMYIQNYNGPVTIGFNQMNAEISTIQIPVIHLEGDVRHPGRKEITINVGLQALKTGFDKYFLLEDKFDTPIFINKGDTLRVQTWYSPVDNELSSIYETDENDLKNTRFVDEKFMVRRGEDVVVTREGYEELEAINAKHPSLVSGPNLARAFANRTTRPIDAQNETNDYKSDFRPCQAIYSYFHFT